MPQKCVQKIDFAAVRRDVDGLARAPARAAHTGDLLRQAARPERELEAPAADHVERRRRLGEHRRQRSGRLATSVKNETRRVSASSVAISTNVSRKRAWYGWS